MIDGFTTFGEETWENLDKAIDEANQTSLGGVELYPNVWGEIFEIKNLKRHPFEFYQKLGYEITGVVPDPNGFGKPDILMCKRV